MSLPKFSLILLHQTVQIQCTNKLIFQIGKIAQQKIKKNNTTAVNVSLYGVFALSNLEFGCSIVFGSSWPDENISLFIRTIEICYFKLKVPPQKQILRLDIDMSDLISVEIINSIDELVEIGSNKLFGFTENILERKTVEVSIGGHFHEETGLFRFQTHDSDIF